MVDLKRNLILPCAFSFAFTYILLGALIDFILNILHLYSYFLSLINKLFFIPLAYLVIVLLFYHYSDKKRYNISYQIINKKSFVISLILIVAFIAWEYYDKIQPDLISLIIIQSLCYIALYFAPKFYISVFHNQKINAVGMIK